MVEPQSSLTLGFAGTVEPQYKVDLGFQTLGRVVARDVNVGDTVVEGQRLAALDSVAAELAVRVAESDLASAQAQQANATASETRQLTLVEENTGSQADLDAARQARESADAGPAGHGHLAKAKEQLGYTALTATFDGIVTAVGAEVGQTVSAGADVVTVARPDLSDAVVDIPDHFDDLLALAPSSTWRCSSIPQWRPRQAARDRAACRPDHAHAARRITLDNPPSLRLGTTVTATVKTPDSRDDRAAGVRDPRT